MDALNVGDMELVWTGFGLLTGARTICKDKVLTLDSNTTNLFNHLKQKNPEENVDSQTSRECISYNYTDNRQL